MRRRHLVSLLGATGALALSGCVDSGGTGCPDSEVVEVRVDPATVDTPTPGRGDTPAPVPITEDYVVVTVRNDATESRTLAGYVVAGGDRHEYTRDVPPEAGTVEFRFGAFGHHAVQDHQFRFVGC